MPTMTATPQTESKVQTKQRKPSPLNEDFDSIIKNQRWNPKQHPYMYSMMMGYNMRSLAGVTLVSAAKADSGARKFFSAGSRLTDALTGLGGTNNLSESDLKALVNQLITHQNNGGKGKKPPRKDQLDAEIREALQLGEILGKAEEDPLIHPKMSFNDAKEIAENSYTKPEDRIFGADLSAKEQNIGKEIDDLFNNTHDAEAKAHVAEMDNQAIPSERVLQEQQLLFPDRTRTKDRGREMDR